MVQGSNRRNQLGQLHDKNGAAATKSGKWAAQEAALLVQEHPGENQAAEKQAVVSTNQAQSTNGVDEWCRRMLSTNGTQA